MVLFKKEGRRYGSHGLDRTVEKQGTGSYIFSLFCSDSFIGISEGIASTEGRKTKGHFLYRKIPDSVVMSSDIREYSDKSLTKMNAA